MHTALNFICGKELDFDAAELIRDRKEGMSQPGKIESIEDLPPSEPIIGLVNQAIALEQAGRKARPAKKPIEVPRLHLRFAEALDADPKAKAVFDGSRPARSATMRSGSSRTRNATGNTRTADRPIIARIRSGF